MKRTLTLLMTLVLLVATKETAANNNFWIAELDAEQTGIANDDPLARAKLRSLIKLRQRKGQFSQASYRPLRQLGLLMQRDGDHEGSIETFRQMQHLVHRHYGVDSAIQLESVDFLINSYAITGQLKAVDTQQHFRHRVSVRAFAPDDERLLSANLKLADWYRNTMRFRSAISLYKESVGLIDADDTKTSVRALRSIALTNYLSGRCCGQQHVDKARQLISISEHADQSDLRRAMVDYIDASYLAQARPELDERDTVDLIDGLEPQLLGYRHPKEFLRVLESTNGLITNVSSTIYVNQQESTIVFGKTETEPKPISIGSPIALCGDTYDELVQGGDQSLAVDVTVMVDKEGRAGDIAIEGSAPAKLLRYLRYALKKSRFRPAIDRFGESSSGELSFKQTFQANDLEVSSATEVSRWNHLLVAQSCQLMDIASL